MPETFVAMVTITCVPFPMKKTISCYGIEMVPMTMRLSKECDWDKPEVHIMELSKVDVDLFA